MGETALIAGVPTDLNFALNSVAASDSTSDPMVPIRRAISGSALEISENSMPIQATVESIDSIKFNNLLQNAFSWIRSQFESFVISGSPISIKKYYSTVNVQSESTAVAQAEYNRDMTLYNLERYKALRAGWDAYNGKMFDEKLINFMKALTVELTRELIENNNYPRKIKSSPASDGSVDIEYILEDSEFAVTVYPGLKDVSFYFQDANRETELSFENCLRK